MGYLVLGAVCGLCLSFGLLAASAVLSVLLRLVTVAGR